MRNTKAKHIEKRKIEAKTISGKNQNDRTLIILINRREKQHKQAIFYFFKLKSYFWLPVWVVVFDENQKPGYYAVYIYIYIYNYISSAISTLFKQRE